jgi:GAF domain-containing protein/ActR/RegA family two-component response regulator
MSTKKESSHKILIVDDDASLRDSLELRLQVEGYDTQAVATAREAIQEMEKTARGYHLVLMDQRLETPWAGINTTQKITKSWPDTEVVVMTGYGDRDASIAAMKAGACRYVYKTGNVVKDIIDIVESLGDMRDLEQQLSDPNAERDLLQNIISTMGGGIAIVDRSYRILYLNNEAKKMINKDVQIGGICWVECYGAHEQDKPCFNCPVQALFEGHGQTKAIKMSARGDRYIETTATPLKREGKIIGAIKTKVDITEREHLHQMESNMAGTLSLGKRLKAILEGITSLGYDRGRLYLLSPDRKVLKGEVEVGGIGQESFQKIQLPLDEDKYAVNALREGRPQIYKGNEFGALSPAYDLLGMVDAPWMDLPLLSEKEPLGIISIDNKNSKKALVENDLMRLMPFAKSAARAIEMAKEHEAIQRRALELEKLREIDSEIVQVLGVEDVLKRIAQASLNLSGASSVNIRLWEGDRLIKVTGEGRYSEIMRDEISIEHDARLPCVKAMEKREPYIANDAQQDEYIEHWKSETKKVETRQILDTIGSFAAFPLEFENEMIGTMVLLSEEKDVFTGTVCAAINDFRPHAATAVRNAKIVQKVGNQVDKLEILHQTSLDIAVHTRVEPLLRSIIRGAVEISEASGGALLLCDPVKEQVEVVVTHNLDKTMGMQLAFGEGLSGRVAQMKSPMILNDYYASPEHSPQFDEEPYQDIFHALVGVPMVWQDEVIGVLNISHSSPSRKTFNTHDTELLERFASRAAAAIGQTRLLEAEARRRREAETLQDAVMTLNISLDQQEVFEHILTELQKVVPYDSASVQLRKGNHLKVISCSGFPNPFEILALSFPIDGDNPNQEVIHQHVLNRKEYFIVRDVSVAYKHFAEEPLVQAGIRSWLGVPMLINNNIIGIITLDKRQSDFYSETHARLALTYAAQAATRIDNVRLFKETQQKKENLDLLLDAINTVANAHGLGEGLSALAEKMVTGLGVSFCHIMLLDNSGQNLLIKAAAPIPRPNSGKLKWNPGIGGTIDLSQNPIRHLKQHLLDISKPQVFRRGKVVNGKDVVAHVQQTVGLKEQLEAVLIIALKIGEKDLGFCTLGEVRHRERVPFTEDKIKLANSMTAQAAVLIDRMRSHETIQRRVLEAGQRITAFHPFRENLRQIIDKLRGVLAYDVVILYPYNFSQDGFDRPVISGKLHAQHAIRPAKKGDVVWKRIKEGPDSHFSSDSASDPLLTGPFIERESIHASGYIRLKIDNQSVGLLFINKRTSHQFSKDEQRIIQEYAERVTQEIRSTSVLQAIVDNLHQAMNFDIVTLYQYNAVRNELSRPFVAGELQEKYIWGPVQSDSPVRNILKGNRPTLFLDDTASTFLAGPFSEREKVKSSGYVRLEVGGQTLGILFVNYRQKHRWEDDEIQAVQLFANQAAIAINNLRHYKSIEKEQERLYALHEAGKAITQAGLERDAVLKTILQTATAVTGAHNGTLQLVEGKNLELIAAWPEEHIDQLKREIGMLSIDGPGITTRAIREDDAQLVDNVNNDPDYVDTKVAITGSELAVVLRYDEQPIGVIDVEHREIGGFDSEDRELLIALSNLVVVALQNAEQAKQRVDDIATLQEINQAVVSKGLQEVLQLVVEKAVEVLPGEYISLWLKELVTGDLVLGAIFGPDEAIDRGIVRLKTGGNSISIRVSKTGKPNICENAAEDPGFHRIYQAAQSSVAVPLQYRGKVIGVLNIESSQLKAFSDQHSRLLGRFADQAAIAIENAHLYKQQVDNIVALKEINQAVASKGLQEVLQLIVAKAVEVLPGEHSSLWLKELVTGDLALGAIFGPDEAINREINRLKAGGNSIKVSVAKTGKHNICENTAEEPSFYRIYQSTQSSVVVPLKYQGEVIGVLSVESSQLKAFTEQHSQLLKGFADQAAIAIDNARLYQAEMEYGRALKAIQTTSAAVSAVFDLDKLLPMITDAAANIFGASATSLMLWDKANEDLVIKTSTGLSKEYVKKQLITKKTVADVIAFIGESRSLITLDLMSEPVGELDLIKAEGLRSVLSTKLLISDQLIGILNIYSKDTPRKFTPKECELAEIFANQAAIAIENARLFEKVKKQDSTRLKYIQDIAHQLTGPLGGLRSHIDNLLIKEWSEERKSEVLQITSDLAGIALRYATNFAYAARIGESIFSPAEFTPQLFDAKELISLLQRHIQSYQGIARIKDLQGPTINIASFEKFPHLNLDSQLFDMLMFNLYDNAIKYSYSGSPIFVKGEIASEKVFIEVTNYGVPIRPEDTKLMSNRYFRSQEAQKHVRTGTGIGLFVCRQIVELHGGKIEAFPSTESELGHEARIRITLPIPKLQ